MEGSKAHLGDEPVPEESLVFCVRDTRISTFLRSATTTCVSSYAVNRSANGAKITPTPLPLITPPFQEQDQITVALDFLFQGY